MKETFFVVPESDHNSLISTVFLKKGFDQEEVDWIVKSCADAARHGIRTHNGLKAIHLDDLFGSEKGGCIPRASITEVQKRFAATRVWNANRKAGPAVAYLAIEECIRLADQFGIGMVNVDNAFHYFWGGAYVIEAARRGYIAYTQCTALLAEVVPFGGRVPALGTNPHTWAFPTTEIVGFPILVDFATSSVAMGRVQQLQREGKRLLPGCAVDARGEATEDPASVAALLPFGAHKGYGLGLVNELMAGYTGGFLPSLRGRPFGQGIDARKNSTCFQFVVICPEAIEGGDYGEDVGPEANIKAILSDIRRPGNDQCLLPGEIEANMAALSDKAGGLLLSEAEVNAFGDIANRVGAKWQRQSFATISK